MGEMRYEAPRTLAATVALLSRADGEARVLAGGTDLLIQMRDKRAVTGGPIVAEVSVNAGGVAPGFASFSNRYTGGAKEFEIEAKNLRGVIRTLDQLYPDLGEHLEKETTVAIDGEIHEVGYYQPLRPGCEVFFIPKIESG